MRHFVVLGFQTSSNSEEGELVHLGSDRGAAIAITNRPGPFIRKQMFELAQPHLRRSFDQLESESEDPEDVAPKLTEGAQKLAEEHQLTAEDLANIEPSGSSGNIVKSDVETFLKVADLAGDDETTDDVESDQLESESEDPEDVDDAE